MTHLVLIDSLLEQWSSHSTTVMHLPITLQFQFQCIVYLSQRFRVYASIVYSTSILCGSFKPAIQNIFQNALTTLQTSLANNLFLKLLSKTIKPLHGCMQYQK